MLSIQIVPAVHHACGEVEVHLDDATTESFRPNVVLAIGHGIRARVDAIRRQRRDLERFAGATDISGSPATTPASKNTIALRRGQSCLAPRARVFAFA
jgi:hypothetical protein